MSDKVKKWIAIPSGAHAINLVPSEGTGPDFFVKLSDYEKLEFRLEFVKGWLENWKHAIPNTAIAVLNGALK